MATSTEILLLLQKVDLLETHMNWVVTGVTGTITALMAIFAVIQFVYQRKIEAEEIKEIEKNLIEKIDEKLIENEETIKLAINKRINVIEAELRRKIGLMEADISRKFAIDCDKDGIIPATAFTWWISAAAEYAENNENELHAVSFNGAKSALESVNTKRDTEILLERANQISKNIKKLRNKYPMEADIIDGLFKKKIEATPNH